MFPERARHGSYVPAPLVSRDHVALACSVANNQYFTPTYRFLAVSLLQSGKIDEAREITRALGLAVRLDRLRSNAGRAGMGQVTAVVAGGSARSFHDGRPRGRSVGKRCAYRTYHCPLKLRRHRVHVFLGDRHRVEFYIGGIESCRKRGQDRSRYFRVPSSVATKRPLSDIVQLVALATA